MRTASKCYPLQPRGGVGMKTTVYILVLFCCLSVAHRAAAEQGGLIYAASGKLTPLVTSAVNNFRGVLEGSTIIVMNLDGDEQTELAKIESFLAGKKGFKDTPKTVESIRRQFRRDKTGFSYPIWLRNDRSANVNACVLAVKQRGQPSHTSMISMKIYKPLITGNWVRPLDGEVIQASIIAHEMYHCYEYLSGSMMDYLEKQYKTRSSYASHLSESAADAYAALYVLQKYNALTTVRMQMEFRRIGMLNSDVEHNTWLTVEQVLKSFNREQLLMMAPEELILLAAAIRDDKAMNENSFVALKKSSIELTRAYLSLLSGLPSLDLKEEKIQLMIEEAMLMDDLPLDPRLTAHVLNEITASFYTIGAGRAVSSNIFQSLVAHYAPKEISRLRFLDD